MTRREILLALAALGLAPAPLRAGTDGAETLIAAARALAGMPWQPDRMALAPPFADLDYDRARGIRPRDGAAGGLPLGGGLVADALPPGPGLADRVAITLPGQAAPMPFSADLFHFDPRLFPDAILADPGRDAGLGFSGLRLRGPMNRPDRLDEILVLQGASYFRALPHEGRYGLSARALGLGTGGAGPEEFPVTRQIVVWGVAGGAVELGCLIDSPRAAAALVVRLTPGSAAHPATVMDCALHLFPRRDLHDAGIAPLTSMFLKNPLGPAWIDDFRPAVHDSDALVIDTGDQRLWRALQNPEHPQTSVFADAGPQGFGLVQGIDRFDRAQDAAALYHRRPSAWVEPLGDWGAGAVHLLELPTLEEYHDTIVAFWRPAQPLAAGQAHRFDYRLHWLPAGVAALPAVPLALVPQRAASGLAPGTRATERLYVVDFSPATPGQPLPAADTLLVDVAADPPGPYIRGVTMYPIDDSDGRLRVSFLLAPGEALERADLRLTLRHAASGDLAAPVWLARWTRRGDGRT